MSQGIAYVGVPIGFAIVLACATFLVCCILGGFSDDESGYATLDIRRGWRRLKCGAPPALLFAACYYLFPEAKTLFEKFASVLLVILVGGWAAYRLALLEVKAVQQ